MRFVLARALMRRRLFSLAAGTFALWNGKLSRNGERNPRVCSARTTGLIPDDGLVVAFTCLEFGCVWRVGGEGEAKDTEETEETATELKRELCQLN